MVATRDNSVRLDYLDALRTIACFAVVMLHVTASNTYHVDFRSHEWNIFMFFESIVNWAVPVFVMISGSVMLRKQYTYTIVIKKTKRIVLLFIFWSVIYLFSDMLINKDINYNENALWLQVVLQGHYHLWYMIMLCGLYIIVPIIKVIVDKPPLMKAFILLSLIFSFIIPSIKDLPKLDVMEGVLKIPVIGALFRAFSNIVEDTHFHFTVGFISYFVIGYYVVHEMEPRSFQAGILISIISIVLGAILVYLEIRFASSKEASGSFMQYYQFGILMQTVGLVRLAQYISGTRIIKVLAKLSPMTLGVYIIHPIILETLGRMGVSSLSFNPFISVPVLALFIFSGTMVIAKIIMKTPFNALISISRNKKRNESAENG